LHLDLYEGAEYQRQQLTVTSASDQRRHNAWCYLLKPAYRHRLSPRPWQVTDFSYSQLKQKMKDNV